MDVDIWISPPSRGRGLKHFTMLITTIPQLIAPFTGARIETLGGVMDDRVSQIAPFTGARIETDKSK